MVEYDEKDKSGEVTEYWDGVKDKSSPTDGQTGWSDRIEDLDSKMSVCWLSKADEPRR